VALAMHSVSEWDEATESIHRMACLSIRSRFRASTPPGLEMSGLPVTESRHFPFMFEVIRDRVEQSASKAMRTTSERVNPKRWMARSTKGPRGQIGPHAGRSQRHMMYVRLEYQRRLLILCQFR
jgi:hypothetical protein